MISFGSGRMHQSAVFPSLEQLFRIIREGLDIDLVLIYDRQNWLIVLNWQ